MVSLEIGGLPARAVCGRWTLYNEGRNAHRTDECKVLYRWHPWFGRVVAVHEVIERAAGRVVRCRLTEAGSDRWLELPAWMLDRAACVPMRVAAQPRVDVGSLAALQALLTEASNAGSCCAASNARVLGTGRNVCDQKPGDAHVPPTPPSSAHSRPSSSVRSVRSPLHQQPAGAGMERIARGDPPESDLADGAPSSGTRTRRSASGVCGRLR
jgi:hypothetical protein